MKAFQWKCQLCETVNTDVACAKCGHVPDYYIPLPSVTLKPEQIAPVVEEAEPFTEQETWFCENCGAENELKDKRCRECSQPREQKKPKPKKERVKGSVRPGVVVSVFLVCLLAILVVVLGKITAITRPEVFTNGLGSLFDITITAPEVPAVSISPTTAPVAVNRVYPNPPVDGCKLWSDVTLEDAGQTLCVYGLVYDTYLGDPGQLNFRFSEEKDAFRMVLTGVPEDEILPDFRGVCVYQSGVVKFYKALTYISFTDMVSICEQ